MKVEVKKRMQPLLAILAMVVTIGTIATMVVGTVACKSTDDAISMGDNNNEAAQIREAREKKIARLKESESPTLPPSPATYFKQVILTPQSSSEGTAINIKAEITVPLEESQYITYIYWKNNQPSREIKESVIPASLYKKNDLIMVEAVFHDGEEILAKKKSDQTAVPNTAPVIMSVTIPEIDGPGEYTIVTEAKDADEDTLTFSLSPKKEDGILPEGLSIDASSGEITYTLTETTPPEEVVQFILTADDGDGGIAKKSIDINFNLKKAIRQVKVEGKKEEKSEEKKDGK